MLDSLQLYLARLDDRSLASLERLFLARPPGKPALRKVELAAALRAPLAVERGLDGLRPDALAALSVLIDAGDLTARGPLLEELQAALGPDAGYALEALSNAGLVFKAPHSDQIGVPKPIAEALAPFVPGVEPPVEAPGESDPLRFDQAVVLALLAGERPRVNRDGRVNVSDLRKLEKRVARSPRIQGRFDLLIDALFDAGALHAGERLELRPRNAERHFAQPFSDWYAEIARRGLRWWPAFRAHALVLGAGRRWIPEETILRAIRLQYAAWDRADPREQLDRLAAFLFLERTSDGDGRRLVRAPQPPPPETGKLVMQPSFEVLAPPDTPPMVVAELGRFAELQHADRFATFRLTEAATQSAIDEGASIDHLLALLTVHAAHGVPQNVEHTIRGWGQVARRAVMSAGVAIYFDDAGQASAAARALADAHIDGIALGDRVLVVPSWEQARVRSLLRKQSMRVLERQPDEPPDTVEQEDEPEPRGGARLAPSAETLALQARLRERIATRPPTVAAPPAPAQDPSVRAALERAARTGEPLLIRAWDLDRVVRVERLRQRRSGIYAEVATVDGHEAFSIPLDAVVEAEPLATRGPLVSGDKIGRNAPCPCGSGKKYKRCCLGGPSPSLA